MTAQMLDKRSSQTVSGFPAKYSSSSTADELAVKAAQNNMSKGTLALIALGVVAFIGVGAMAVISKK